MRSDKSYNLCIMQKKKKITKKVYNNNEFNKVIKQNEYYIYKF